MKNPLGTQAGAQQTKKAAERQMNKVTLGFQIAALYNFFILLFSKGFSNDLGAVDVLFSPGGCAGILLWGAAYFSLAKRYKQAPGVSLVFCLEKAFYGLHWFFWIFAQHATIPTLFSRDPLSAVFFSIYGIGDLLFMIFFGWVAWQWRHNLAGAEDEA